MASKRKIADVKDDGKSAKKPKNCQRFKQIYSQMFPHLIRSEKGETYAHCNVCDIDFSCAHGGQNDCKRHVQTKNHKDYLEIRSSNTSLKSFFSKPKDTTSKDHMITKAEVAVCELVADLNLSISTVDKLCPLFKSIFPDSDIAKGMKCGRNKATAIIHDLARITQDGLTTRMLNGPYTISTDGSNDAVSKQFPIVVRSMDPTTMSVNSELLSVPICTGSATGENIFSVIDKEMKLNKIPWKNCLALGCDNANVMTGHKKGVYAFMKKEVPELFLSGCPLHLIHIAAKKGAECLPPVDEVLVDVYYYFNKSDKRKSEFQGTQKLYDVDQRKILKHVCTRWLSISRCLTRMIDNWSPLKVYFYEQKCLIDKKKHTEESSRHKATKVVEGQHSKQSHRKSSSQDMVSKQTLSDKVEFEKTYMEQSYAEKKIESIYSFVRSPTNKLYCLFLQYTLELFDEILTTLQAEDPRIHVLRRCLLKLLRSLLVRFVKPSAMLYKEVYEVQYSERYNIKTNSELMIGDLAKQFIESKRENHLKDSRIEEFYVAVVKFFQTACGYLCKKLPLNDPVLIHAEVADVSLQATAHASSLKYFLDRFPCLMPASVPVDRVIEQFANYQSYDLRDKVVARMDETWGNIGSLKDENGNEMFRELSFVMLGILTIPHSSAHCERVFSQVRKNRTEQRASMGDKTLESLLVLKSRPKQFWEKDNVCVDTLSRLKSAYYRSLKD